MNLEKENETKPEATKSLKNLALTVLGTILALGAVYYFVRSEKEFAEASHNVLLYKSLKKDPGRIIYRSPHSNKHSKPDNHDIPTAP